MSTPSLRLRFDRFFHRLVNPSAIRKPEQTLLETIGRKSGQPRITPIGGARVGDEFWLVSEHGTDSDYVRNLMANPAVRVRIAGEWHTGTAHPLPDDDPRARLATLPRFNSTVVRALGTNLLTIRIDLS
ncbi:MULTISPECIES: nitroreductase/quinone reductase family protein [unclassified Nocardia]|uniref:nitroreductase/quinone reductase family protein n=1 Tax=unclassified Nocardia TaxID=2637762 RepID=UPI001CE3C5B4|nr:MULTISPECIES: nitroreductase/quinone reductase family protein [unclassified Nocardia]